MIKAVQGVTMRQRIAWFVWQHIILILSMYLMTLGVALCVRSELGSGVISAIPMAFSIAGQHWLSPALTIGGYTNIMNVVLVLAQIFVLRRKFQKIQLLQLIIGFLFGAMLDANMYITSFWPFRGLASQIAEQLMGATILGVAVAAEVRCGSVTMLGEGIQVAISRISGIPFPKTKIMVDSGLVVLAVISGYIFFGHWMWNVVGPGTLFAMFYVGWVVKKVNPHMEWFDRLLNYRPRFRRYIYGLARFIYPKNKF